MVLKLFDVLASSSSFYLWHDIDVTVTNH